MKCPLCSTEAGDAKECPSCGAIFSKLRDRKERRNKEAAEGLAQLASRTAPAGINPWTGRAIALLIVIFWTIGFAFYYKIHFSFDRKPRVDGPFVPPAEKSRAFVRDPETGKLTPVRIIKAPSALQRPSDQERGTPPPSGAGPRPEGGPAHDPDFDD